MEGYKKHWSCEFSKNNNNIVISSYDASQYKYMGISSHIGSDGDSFVETAIILQNGRTFSHNNYRAHNGLVFCPFKLHNRDFLLLPASDDKKIIFVNNVESLFYRAERLDQLPSALLLERAEDLSKFCSVTEFKFKGVRYEQLVPIIVRNSIQEPKSCPYCSRNNFRPKNCILAGSQTKIIHGE